MAPSAQAGLLSLRVAQAGRAPRALRVLRPSSPSSCRKHLLEDVDGKIDGEQGAEGRGLGAERQRQACFTRRVVLQQLDLDAGHHEAAPHPATRAGRHTSGAARVIIFPSGLSWPRSSCAAPSSFLLYFLGQLNGSGISSC